ncbi:MAG: hypothetical protein V1779_15895 [bacterium]
MSKRRTVPKDTPIPAYRRTSGIAGVTEISASHTIGGAKITKPLKVSEEVKTEVTAVVKKKTPIVRTKRKKFSPTKVYDADLKPILIAYNEKTGMSYSAIYKMCFSDYFKLNKKLMK